MGVGPWSAGQRFPVQANWGAALVFLAVGANRQRLLTPLPLFRAFPEYHLATPNCDRCCP